MSTYNFFDMEIIGTKNVTVILCFKQLGSDKFYDYDLTNEEHISNLEERMIAHPDDIWVGYNSLNFDVPILNAILSGQSTDTVKLMIELIINQNYPGWKVMNDLGVPNYDYPHIDLFNVAPGVKLSLKLYAARMHMPELRDLPFEPDRDLTPEEVKVLYEYCHQDLRITEVLFTRLTEQIKLRAIMGEQYGVDLLSKSDSQMAETILKDLSGLFNKQNVEITNVTYNLPKFIKPSLPITEKICSQLDGLKFILNNGNAVKAGWMATPVKIRDGAYTLGIGGLHSIHDQSIHHIASPTKHLIDFDAASYYPTLFIELGMLLNVNEDQGNIIYDAYKEMFHKRLAAKAGGDKVTNECMKIMLNGTFGKLGSKFSALYAPEILLAITITGQLNLLNLIEEVEASVLSAKVLSANTDGILIEVEDSDLEQLRGIFNGNSFTTNITYEETHYKQIAIINVNNYIAQTIDGKWKRKGMFGLSGLNMNPQNDVCKKLVQRYLEDGTVPETAIYEYEDIRDYVTCRTVRGGCLQHTRYELRDDWEKQPDGTWRLLSDPRKKARRVNKPKPVEVGFGGEPMGRVARWYNSTSSPGPIRYVGSGNKVPNTDKAMLAMHLPESMPKDLDLNWYVDETYKMLTLLGVSHDRIVDSDGTLSENYENT